MSSVILHALDYNYFVLTKQRVHGLSPRLASQTLGLGRGFPRKRRVTSAAGQHVRRQPIFFMEELMASKIKTRTNCPRALKPWRIVIPNAERNGEPLVFTADDRKAMMREREKERSRSAYVPAEFSGEPGAWQTRPVRIDKERGTYRAKYRAPVIDRNERYPWAEIVAAKKEGRKLIPRTRAAHWG